VHRPTLAIFNAEGEEVGTWGGVGSTSGAPVPSESTRLYELGEKRDTGHLLLKV